MFTGGDDNDPDAITPPATGGARSAPLKGEEKPKVAGRRARVPTTDSPSPSRVSAGSVGSVDPVQSGPVEFEAEVPGTPGIPGTPDSPRGEPSDKDKEKRIDALVDATLAAIQEDRAGKVEFTAEGLGNRIDNLNGDFESVSQSGGSTKPNTNSNDPTKPQPKPKSNFLDALHSIGNTLSGTKGLTDKEFKDIIEKISKVLAAEGYTTPPYKKGDAVFSHKEGGSLNVSLDKGQLKIISNMSPPNHALLAETWAQTGQNPVVVENGSPENVKKLLEAFKSKNIEVVLSETVLRKLRATGLPEDKVIANAYDSKVTKSAKTAPVAAPDPSTDPTKRKRPRAR